VSGSEYTIPGYRPEATPPDGTEGVAIGSALEHSANIANRGLGNLIEKFQGKPRIAWLLVTLLDQVQEWEDALWDIYVLRNLEDATGDLLDQLGGIVGESRRGRTDDEYRRFIGVRILSNRSDGQIEDLYTILRAIWPDFSGFIRDLYPASMLVEIQNPITSETPMSEVNLVLGRSKPGGVSLFAGYTSVAVADSMIIDSALSPFTTAGQAIGSSVGGAGGAMWSVYRA
jgi:hypothetical protein